MARSRNIKPGFFTNEVLGEMSPLARILFAGMWCHADREGRLEDRMKRLKPQVLPYDDCDIEALAQCLHDAGLVYRYVVDGKGYIQVIEFKKHQNPHVKEQASTIPAPDMHRACTGVAGLIPDSLNLIPSSLIPDSSVLDSLKPKPGKVKNNTHSASACNRPPEVSEQVWIDFMAIRKAKRSPLTATALAGIQREATKAGMSLQDALAVACERGWQGFKADWITSSDGHGRKNLVERNKSSLDQWVNKETGGNEHEIK
jgi:hypothetical protein